MSKHENRAADGRWLKGQTGNAAGRGMTNRQRISEKLLTDLAVVWERHGETVLERLAETEPGKLATIAYGLLPKDVFISVQQESAILPEDRALLVDLLRTIKGAVPADAPTTPVLEFIGDALRAEYAKLIEAE